MSLPVVFRRQARAEFDEGAAWYEQQAGLGAEFIAAVRQVLDLVADNPRMYRVVHKDVRRAGVRRFPYSVLYRAEPGRIVVIAIMHGRRNPATWQNRI